MKLDILLEDASCQLEVDEPGRPGPAELTAEHVKLLTSMGHQTVLVVDFGGQYTQLIVRRVREFGVYSEMVPWTNAEAKIREAMPDAVILSGGPKSVLEDGAPTLDMSLLEGVPVLGICYGQQLMA